METKMLDDTPPPRVLSMIPANPGTMITVRHWAGTYRPTWSEKLDRVKEYVVIGFAVVLMPCDDGSESTSIQPVFSVGRDGVYDFATYSEEWKDSDVEENYCNWVEYNLFFLEN